MYAPTPGIPASSAAIGAVGRRAASDPPFVSSPLWQTTLGAAAQAGYEIVVADPVAGEQFAVTVEIDNLGKDEGECVDTVRHSCSTKHPEHLLGMAFASCRPASSVALLV